jgi:RNA 2',3'-cyclic 3'-phosphodiesterase
VSGIRSFVAIELDPRVQATLNRAHQAVDQYAPAWAGEKWVAQENLHITLAFLGDLDGVTLSELNARLSVTLQGRSAFPLELEGVAAMPPTGRHTMLWATFADPSGFCSELAAAVADAASECGITLAEKPFTPHVTLVRARRPRRMAPEVIRAISAALTANPISMSVASATLVSSTLTPHGPIYERLAAWSFIGAA